MYNRERLSSVLVPNYSILSDSQIATKPQNILTSLHFGAVHMECRELPLEKSKVAASSDYEQLGQAKSELVEQLKKHIGVLNERLTAEGVPMEVTLQVSLPDSEVGIPMNVVKGYIMSNKRWMNHKFHPYCRPIDTKEVQQAKKECSKCGTVKTPEWRTGPTGSLVCNACGLKYRRKKKHELASKRKHAIANLLN